MVPGYGSVPEEDDDAGWAAIEWGEHELDYVLFVQLTTEQEQQFEVCIAVRV